MSFHPAHCHPHHSSPHHNQPLLQTHHHIPPLLQTHHHQPKSTNQPLLKTLPQVPREREINEMEGGEVGDSRQDGSRWDRWLQARLATPGKAALGKIGGFKRDWQLQTRSSAWQWLKVGRVDWGWDHESEEEQTKAERRELQMCERREERGKS